MVGSLDAIRAGTTAVIDHNASPSCIGGSLRQLQRAFEQCGLRGILCYEVTDRNGEEGRNEGVEENRVFIQHHEGGAVRGAVGAHAPFTLSEESMHMLADVVGETGRGIHIHVSEDLYEPSFSHHRFGCAPLERLERHGLLSDMSLIVHGVHLLEREIELLERTDAALIHNPRSNMNNTVGYNPRVLDLGHAALGTDGMGSDMFAEARFALFRGREARRDIFPGHVMRLLDNGNRILERYFGGRFGRVEQGYTADLVMLDYEPPTPLREENAAGHFVYGIDAGTVNTVLVGGNIVYEEGAFPFDVGPVYENAREQAARLWQAMDSLTE
jgi:putative selenium metabolism protein SsnA